MHTVQCATHVDGSRAPKMTPGVPATSMSKPEGGTKKNASGQRSKTWYHEAALNVPVPALHKTFVNGDSKKSIKKPAPALPETLVIVTLDTHAH